MWRAAAAQRPYRQRGRNSAAPVPAARAIEELCPIEQMEIARAGKRQGAAADLEFAVETLDVVTHRVDADHQFAAICR